MRLRIGSYGDGASASAVVPYAVAVSRTDGGAKMQNVSPPPPPPPEFLRVTLFERETAAAFPHIPPFRPVPSAAHQLRTFSREAYPKFRMRSKRARDTGGQGGGRAHRIITVYESRATFDFILIITFYDGNEKSIHNDLQ